MDIFLTIFGTIAGLFLLFVSLSFTDIGIFLSILISMAGFIGPIFAGINRKVFK